MGDDDIDTRPDKCSGELLGAVNSPGRNHWRLTLKKSVLESTTNNQRAKTKNRPPTTSETSAKNPQNEDVFMPRLHRARDWSSTHEQRPTRRRQRVAQARRQRGG